MKTLKPYRYMLPFTNWADKTHCAGCGYSGEGDCLCRDAPEAGTGRELGPDAEWGGGQSFTPEHRAAREADAFWDYDRSDR